ncbi:MAG: hypothetical protein KGH93_03385 [Patescibacteria group bacterium]|nr:hypothetical protein [Patescibacteria group bacterium]MDE1946208.1 hypothetical protein [Patescibacteria group bacterium]
MTDRNKISAAAIFGIMVVVFGLLYSGVIHVQAPDIRTYHGWLPVLIAAAALVDSVNPCAFSVLFLTLAFLFSIGRSRKNIFQAGLSYVFGIFATYMLIGLGILRVLSIFNVPNVLAKAGAFAIILFGLINLTNEFFPKFPIKLKIPDFAYGRLAKLMEKATMPATFALGIAVGLFEFPCTGGPYLFVLGLLHDAHHFWSGLGYLVFYNLVFILPLFIALLIASSRKVLEAMDTVRKAETKKARVWIALAMILLGAVIFMIQ